MSALSPSVDMPISCRARSQHENCRIGAKFRAALQQEYWPFADCAEILSRQIHAARTDPPFARASIADAENARRCASMPVAAMQPTSPKRRLNWANLGKFQTDLSLRFVLIIETRNEAPIYCIFGNGGFRLQPQKANLYLSSSARNSGDDTESISCLRIFSNGGFRSSASAEEPFIS